MNTIGYYVSIKSRFGNLSTFFNTFADEKHFTNWYNALHKKGSKIIGVDPVLPNIDCKKLLSKVEMTQICYMAFGNKYTEKSEILYNETVKGNYAELIIDNVPYRALLKNEQVSFYENKKQVMPDAYPQIEAYIRRINK